MTSLSKEVTGLPFRMPESARIALRKIALRTTKSQRKLDAVMIYTGEEGSGKSTLMTQHAYAVSQMAGTELTLDNFKFTPKQFITGINEGKPRGTPMIYDEAINGLMAVMGRSKEGIKLQITFGTCRSKQYPIFLAAPRIYQLPYWLVWDRALGMYETWIEWDDEEELHGKNFFKGYSRKGLRIYYASLKERWANRPKIITTEPEVFSGYPFTKDKVPELPFSSEEYERAKQKALAEEDKSDWRKEKELSDRDVLINLILDNKWMGVPALARKISINDARIYEIHRRGGL